jgi:hypothetical protein
MLCSFQMLLPSIQRRSVLTHGCVGSNQSSWMYIANACEAKAANRVGKIICFKWWSTLIHLNRVVAIDHYPIFAVVAYPTIPPCQTRLGSVAEGMPDRSVDLPASNQERDICSRNNSKEKTDWLGWQRCFYLGRMKKFDKNTTDAPIRPRNISQ